MPLKFWQVLRCVLTGFAAFALTPVAAHAVSIELKDEAPDRIERQRTAAMGRMPLPGTPDVSKFNERLESKGMKAGQPVFLRVFKAQSELEVWIEKDGVFQLFDTYPICHWSGTLGPKTYEGDKQTPEGFYTVTSRQLHRIGRWRQALNLGFPNAYDQSLKRDGSYILVHGGCSSVGCFAMTNPVIEEIYKLTAAALRAGQRHVPVHVFPFRMTEEALKKHETSEWHEFWGDLKSGYDSFERTKQPPRVSVCNGRYQVQDVNSGPLEAGGQGPLAVCGPTAAELLSSDKSAWLVPLEPPQPQQRTEPQTAASLSPLPAMIPWPVVTSQQSQPSRLTEPASVPQMQLQPPGQQQHSPATGPQQPVQVTPLPQSQPPQAAQASLEPPAASLLQVQNPSQPSPAPEPGSIKGVTSVDLAMAYEFVPRLVAPQPKPGQSSVTGARATALPCSLSLPSCRRYAALLARQSSKQRAIAKAQTRRDRALASR